MQTEENNITETTAVTKTAPKMEYNTEVLSEDELDTFNSTKDLSDAEVMAMPAYLRDEITAVRSKAASAGADTAATSEKKPEPESESDVTPPATEPDTPEENIEENSNPESNYEEMIRMLTEENRKLQARYSTLQGKYNAEVKNIKTKTPEDGNNGNKDDTSEELFSETAKADDTSAVVSEDDINAIAEKYGIDTDVAKALVGIVSAKTQGIHDELAAERNQRLDFQFDRALKNKCGGLGLAEIGSHPFFDHFASTMINSQGKSAAEDIAEAKANLDLERAALIVSKVVDEIKKENKWDIPGYSAKAEPGFSSNVSSAPVAAAGKTAEHAPAPVVKPSVIPHSSGNVASPLQTARTEKDVEDEYKQLDARFRRGDFSVVTRMEQLGKEYSKLLSGKKP